MLSVFSFLPGVELTLILTNSSIGLWTPDVRFHDASDLNYLVQVHVVHVVKKIQIPQVQT